MSHAEDMAPDEITGRTAIAQEALHTSYDAQMKALGIKRRLERTQWVWGVLAFLITIIGAGWLARGHLDDLATKEQVERLGDAQARAREFDRQIEEHQRGLDQSVKRLADGFDELNRYMRERRR